MPNNEKTLAEAVREGMEPYLQEKARKTREFYNEHQKYSDVLTAVEEEVMERLSAGETLRDVAKDMDCTPQAIYSYRERSKKKLVEEKNKDSIIW